MFGRKKTISDGIDMTSLNNEVDHTLITFKKEMTEFVPDVVTREDADRYVKDHAEAILKRISDASIVYSRKVIDLKKKRNEIDAGSFLDSNENTVLAKLDLTIKLLEESYIQIFQIVNPDSPRSLVHYYTQTEIADLSRGNQSVLPENHDRMPKDLIDRLADEYIEKYLPDDSVIKTCAMSPSKTTPEKVLQAICVGDYIGQPYGKALSASCFDVENPLDTYVTHDFTDNAFLSFAIYDVCKSIKEIENASVKTNGVIVQAYDMFVSSLQYYASMFPDVGYEPRFYSWAVDRTGNCESWSNDGTARACIIGAFFNDIKDVIRYAIVSAYATHSHRTGEQGAVFAAVCMWMALHGAAKHEIRDYVLLKSDDIVCLPEELDGAPEKIFDLLLLPDDINALADENGRTYTLSGVRTLSQALISFLNASNMKECLLNSMKFPCDTATVDAISCGIAVSYFASINKEISYLDQIIGSKDDESVSYPTAFIMKRLAEL